MSFLDCRPTLPSTHFGLGDGVPVHEGSSLGQTDAGRPGLPHRGELGP